ncbi:MAG: class I SAM-dependent methyltransferase, partial [Thermodesulfobacteriota bacterium]
DWDSDPDKLERARVTAERIREVAKVTKDMRAFEYGCGTGQVSFFLQPYLGELVLADDSKGMLEVVREKIKRAGVNNMRAINLDLSKDGLPSNEKFDLIHVSMTLHHIIDTAPVLDAFHKLLAPGGSLCIADFDLDDGSFHADHPDFDGHHGFDRGELKKMLEDADFKVESFETCFMIDKEIDGQARQYPVFLAHARKA